MDNKDSSKVNGTLLPGVFLINRPVAMDERGFFREIFRKDELEAKLGYSINFVQANHSRSKKGVLRGIHSAPWPKLIYVVRGMIQSVLVDLREDSAYFGQYMSLTLGEENKIAVFIPPQLGNSFLTLSQEADVTYLVGDYWQIGKEQSVIWNDPDLKINWMMSTPTISQKDQQNLFVRDLYPKKFIRFRRKPWM